MSERTETVTIDATRAPTLRMRMQERSEALFRAVGVEGPDELPPPEREREPVAMEGGRVHEDERPVVDRARSRLQADDLDLAVRADVSRWNRREVAAASVHLHLKGPDFSVSVGRSVQGTDQVGSLAVRAKGLDEERFQAVVDWVRSL